MVAVYSLEGDQATFHSINYFVDYTQARSKTHQQLYEDRKTHSNDPEDITLVTIDS